MRLVAVIVLAGKLCGGFVVHLVILKHFWASLGGLGVWVSL